MIFFGNKNKISNSTVVQSGGNTKVTQNGKTITVKGTNVSVQNGKIYVDGKLYTDDIIKEDMTFDNITIQGNAETITCDGNVTILGNVNGDIRALGNVNIEGGHTGEIDCGGNINIDTFMKR